MSHPYDRVVIAGGYNTPQAKVLPGHDSVSIAVDAALGLCDEVGIQIDDVDAIIGRYAGDVAYALGLGSLCDTRSEGGIWALMLAVGLIQSGQCEMLLIADGGAGVHTDVSKTAPWTRPDNEFVACFGLYTAVEFALIARRHMEVYGTTPHQLATVAATIRNHGSENPDAVFHGKGPFTAEDILASRDVAEPFHLLDCSMTSEGGCAILLTTPERAADMALPPVRVLGGGVDHYGPPYKYAPVWDLRARRDDHGVPLGQIGRTAARRAFATAGVGRDEIDSLELYDPFSFEIIRQLEAFEICGEGEGGGFVESGGIDDARGGLPVTTDGGTMAFSHGGGNVQMMQRIVRGVHQIQGRCRSRQVPGAEVVLCSNGGAGAFFTDVAILGSDLP